MSLKPGGARGGLRNVSVGAGDAIPDSDLLQNRYDARKLDMSDGDVIDPFADLEGATDLNALGGPVLDANAINGHAASYYDGTDDAHSNTFGSQLSQPFVLAFALRIRSVDTGDNEYYFEDPNEGARIVNNLGEWQIADSTGSFNGGSISSGNHIVVARFDGGDSSLRVDGVEQTSADLSDGTDGLRFAEQEGSGGNNGPISIGQQLTYDGVPTISDVESYLSDEFGIAI